MSLNLEVFQSQLERRDLDHQHHLGKVVMEILQLLFFHLGHMFQMVVEEEDLVIILVQT